MRENDPTGFSYRMSDVYPASLIQRQFWVLHSVAPNSPAYNLPMVSVIEGDLNVAALESKYSKNATKVDTPTEIAFQGRSGVCQDFAHIAIACLRSIGIPARYVSGYLRTLPAPGKPRLIGNDQSHAWVSAWCGDELGWVDFDPTNHCFCKTDHICIAWGRDYSDVVPIKGVFLGAGEPDLHVSVDVLPFVKAD